MLHPYIVTGPSAAPTVMSLAPQISLSYLALRSLCEDSVGLTARTFGEQYTHAWPAFEHDVLVALTNIDHAPNVPLVRGLAAALLLRKPVVAMQLPPMSPLQALLNRPANGTQVQAEPPTPPAPKKERVKPPSKFSSLMMDA